MSTVATPFKYIFLAEYTDGSVFRQPLDDRCKDFDPNAEWNPSSFRDVEQDRLKAFYLCTPEEGIVPPYAVNLKTGEFTVNGRTFTAHDQYFDPTKYDLRLIYFRETYKNFNLDHELIDEGVSRYFIGWQCTDENGKNIQATIGVT